MSADNGVYIVRFPNDTSNCGYEWRVAVLRENEVGDWDNEDWNDESQFENQDYNLFQIFGKKTTIVFSSEEDASVYAHNLYDQIVEYCPYGILGAEFRRPLNPNAKNFN